MSGVKVDPVARFLAKLEPVSEPTGTACVLWTAQKLPSGYGLFWTGERKTLAHRFAYEQFVGPIPEGHHVHHRCGTKGCVNPLHLVALAQPEHVAEHLAEACAHGHAWTPENTRIVKGVRHCRACDRVRSREYRKRHPRRVAATQRRYYREHAETLKRYQRNLRLTRAAA